MFKNLTHLNFKMLDTFLLACSNLLTSAFTAVTGMGGGMMLIALMPFFLPASAIIPVHAATQLVSNASRAWFGRDEIHWEYLRQFILGSLLGLAICGSLIHFVRLDLIPLFIGVYILLLQWSKKFNQAIRQFESFFIVGLLQTGLGVFVGTPGPLNIAILNKYYDDPHVVVSTGAMMMTVVHLAKMVAYVALGFSFLDYAWILMLMMVMAVLGSWLGTKIRHKIRPQILKKILPYILTILALQLIYKTLAQY